MSKKSYIYIAVISILTLFFCTTGNEEISHQREAEGVKAVESEITVTRQELVATVVPVNQRSANTVSVPHTPTASSPKDKKAFSLVKSDKFGTTLRFNLPEFTIETTELSDGQSYAVVNGSGETHPINKKGYPSLPIYKQEILIPVDSTPELTVSNSKFRDLAMAKPIPAVGPISRQHKQPEPTESKFYSSSEIFPKVEVAINEPYAFRGLRAVTVTVYPFAYDNGQEKMRVYDNIEFSVATPTASEIIMKNPLRVADFQRSASETFVNFDAASEEYVEATSRSFPAPEMGKLLIVHPSKFTNTITDFVNWKKLIGFEVETAIYPDATGTSVDSLRAFIDTKSAGGTSHVVLMGESTDIPSRTYYYNNRQWYNETNYSIASPEKNTYNILYSDLYYAGVSLASQPTNSDYIQDLFISRFATSSRSDLEKQLQKIISYERGDIFEPFSNHWLNSVLLTASNDYTSNPYLNRKDWEHFNVQEQILKSSTEYNKFTKVYEGQNPNIADVIDAIDRGVGLTYYLGHGSYAGWHTTGFNANDLIDISTSLPTLSIQPVCQTGGFFRSCFAESQMRSDSFIGILASTNDTDWNPPMVQIEELSKNLVHDSYQTVGGLIFDSVFQSAKWAAQTYSSDLDARDRASAQLHYFGDCSMAFRTKQPAVLEIKVNYFVNKRAPFTVEVNNSGQPVANATVALSYGDTLITTKTDATGIVQLTSPENEESCKITVWSRNAVTVEKIVAINTVYTVNKANFEVGSEILNLNAIIPGSEITSDLFVVENGILKTDQDLDLTDSVSVNISYRDNETGTIKTKLIAIEYNAPSEYSFELAEGWNLLGSPVNSSAQAQQIFIDTASNRTISSNLYYWDSDIYGYSQSGMSEQLPEQGGFWAYSDRNATSKSFAGSSSAGAMTKLNVGWNLYSPATYHPIPEGSLGVWEWNVQEEKYERPVADQLLEPLKGYWIFMTD